MRRLKCIESIPKKYIVFCITGLCLFASILIANNTYAATARVTAGIRGLILEPVTGNTLVYNNNQDPVSVTGNPPFYILGNDGIGSNYAYKVLTGVNFNVSLSGGSTSNKYNQVTSYWTFSQSYSFGSNSSWYDLGRQYTPSMYYATSSGNLAAVSCTLYASTNTTVTWQCLSQTTEQNNPIISASFIWGNYSSVTASNYPTLCMIGAQYSGSCVLSSVTYDYISTPDQSAALLQELNSTVDGINSTIDQNHQEDIERDNQDRENVSNTQDDADSAANSASETGIAATSSLIDAANKLVAVFRDTPASNCVIDVDMGNLDLGNMDFCSGKPSEFNNIISIAIALALTPIAWVWAVSLVRQTVGLAESVSSGGKA